MFLSATEFVQDEITHDADSNTSYNSVSEDFLEVYVERMIRDPWHRRFDVGKLHIMNVCWVSFSIMSVYNSAAPSGVDRCCVVFHFSHLLFV